MVKNGYKVEKGTILEAFLLCFVEELKNGLKWTAFVSKIETNKETNNFAGSMQTHVAMEYCCPQKGLKLTKIEIFFKFFFRKFLILCNFSSVVENLRSLLTTKLKTRMGQTTLLKMSTHLQLSFVMKICLEVGTLIANQLLTLFLGLCDQKWIQRRKNQLS